VRCATAPPELTRGVRETYDFTIGDERFHIIVEKDRATPDPGRRERNARIDGPAAPVRRAFAIMRQPT
jgi:hypothetical protein